MDPARRLAVGSARVAPVAASFAAQRLGARWGWVAELNCYSEWVSFNGQFRLWRIPAFNGQFGSGGYQGRA